MAGLQSSNPVFRNTPTLSRGGRGGLGYPSPQDVTDIWNTPQRLTMDDIVTKTGLLLGIVVLTGAAAWTLGASSGVVALAGIAGFVLALVNIFKRQVSPPLVVAYAACEGVFLGAISRAYDVQYHGIALQAALVTSAIFGGVLLAYRSGRLRATPQFTKVVTGAFLGLFVLLLINGLAGAIGGGNGFGLRSGGGLAIVFSLLFIAIGSMTFVLDFDQAERMVAAGVGERESWRIAFGLVVGLVWLYLEVLRLLSYLQRR